MARLYVCLLIVSALLSQTPRDLKFEKVAPPLPDKRTRWALVIGVSSYKYAPPAAQLKYAHRDAEEFAKLLRSSEGGAFPSDHIRVLTNEAATLGAIRAALHTWLPKSSGPNDVVYLFIAGHAVVAERGDSYFVAHDSDPQNLHATGVSFQEVNDMLSNRLKAATVVLFADACHAGGIGWTSDPSQPSVAQKNIEALGNRDRAFLKLLASRPSEQSFEDERWGGGHGVFTYSVLNAMRGAAEREHDGFVRVSELIDYVSRTVPQETGAKQNPRIAGNFEGALPLASLPADVKLPTMVTATAKIVGQPGTLVYLDNQFRGAIRPTGELTMDTTVGSHPLSIDIPGQPTFDQTVAFKAGPNVLDLQKSAEFAIYRLQRVIRSGNITGPNGAYELYKTQPPSAAADALITSALEDAGQECVSDYVQSTTNALKAPIFLRSAQAFQLLKSMRPNDSSLEAKRLFCTARANIAAGEFEQAVDNLNASIRVDNQFACSYNALGVALGRLGKQKEARQAFDQAADLTPAWALPPLQIAQQLIANNDLKGAAPYLEKAAKLNPKAIGIQWTLARIYRLLNRGPDFVRVATAVVNLDRNYAPIYSEIGQYYEATRDYGRAAQAYDAYVLLAPNFVDSNEVRRHAQLTRSSAPKPKKPKN